MKSAHYLEKALRKVIKEKEIKTVKKLIPILQDKNLLQVLDRKGRNFLYFAIENRALDIANLILNIQKDDAKFINALDREGKSLAWQTSSENYPGLLEKLIQVYESHHSKQWLQGDQTGLTPLHVASQQNYLSIVEILLKKIMPENNCIDIMNQIDVKGNTPLHYALKNPLPQLITLLIEHGADFTLKNNDGQTIFSHFFSLNEINQRNIFNQVNHQIQLLSSEKNRSSLEPIDNLKSFLNFILQSYREWLIKNSNQPKVMTIYFKLAAIQSLKVLLIAHHEFNPKIPKKETHVTLIKLNQEKQVSDITEQKVPDLILGEMPLYKTRLMSISKDKPMEICEDKPIKLQKETTPIKHRYQLISQDNDTLNKLINDIKKFLESNSTKPLSSKSFAVLCYSFLLIAYIYHVFFSWQRRVANQLPGPHEIPPQFVLTANVIAPPFIAFSLLKIFGPLLAVSSIPSLATRLGNGLWKKEANASAKKLSILIDTIQNNILNKLEHLEQNQSPLPTTTQNITDLRTKLQNAHQERPVAEIIAHFKGIQSTLEQIRTDLSLSQNPITRPDFSMQRHF